MNNFKENESTIQPLKIINIQDKVIPTKSEETTSPSIITSYEGGSLLANCDNTVGVNIQDCYGNGLKIGNIKVKNNKGEVINTFATNSEGYGKFDLFKTNLEIYTIEFEHNAKAISKKLDFPVLEGINVTAVNYSDDNKLLITVKYKFNSLCI